MAIKVGSNFDFQGKQPNFERDRFATKAAMKAFPETSIDDGHLSYCAEDGNTYQFKSSNSVDAATGKWRVFKADVDLSKYVTKDAMNTALNKKVDIKGKFVYSESNVKIATINVGNGRYATSTFSIDIRCRKGNILTVNIAINTDDGYEGLLVTAFKNTIGSYSATEKVYYYIDKSDKDNYKVIVFYKNDLYDSILGKITGASITTTTSCILNMEVATELPEGIVEIMDVGYGNKNLFYATPKNAAGDPKFRTIDVADLPDLSSKYATKEKAFTKDTASTEPGQVVAGPPTTQGNLYLRKLIADDIPDLNSKYQRLNSNGYQPNPLMINAKVGADSNTNYKYLTALIYGLPDNIPYKSSPDWYFATDGSLQDITTKIPKVVLDDAVSTTSDNGVKNSVITQYVDSKVTTINSSIADVRTSLESTQTDFVDLRNKVNTMPKTVFITQAAYNALTTKDANTIYYING